jgi:hypothetical protein
MFAPGYGNELMPADEFDTGLQWLAQRVAHDPRFSLATVYTVYHRADRPSRSPTPPTASTPTTSRCWPPGRSRTRPCARSPSEFVAANYNLKLIVREVVLSPYYRGINMDPRATDARKAELVAVGTGRLSTPSCSAARSRRSPASAGAAPAPTSLLGEYKILYGGIDSFDVTQRLGDINQIMAAVATRMALEVACTATAFDFTKPAEERLLFPMVDTADTPEINEGAIRNNLVYLHDRILGETVGPDDARVDASLALFADTWTAGRQAIARRDRDRPSLGSCQAAQGPDHQHRPPRRAPDQDRRHLRHPRVAGRRHLSALRLQVPLRVSRIAPDEQNTTMDRRSFLKIAAMTGLAVAAPRTARARAASPPTRAPSTS